MKSFILGLGPDAQSSNYQRNPVNSMMPYITGNYHRFNLFEISGDVTKFIVCGIDKTQV